MALVFFVCPTTGVDNRFDNVTVLTSILPVMLYLNQVIISSVKENIVMKVQVTSVHL